MPADGPIKPEVWERLRALDAFADFTMRRSDRTGSGDTGRCWTVRIQPRGASVPHYYGVSAIRPTLEAAIQEALLQAEACRWSKGGRPPDFKM